MTSHSLEQPGRSLTVIAQVIVLATALGVLFYAMNNPVQNWDILGYAASVISLENSDPAFIHASVYQQFETYADIANFKRLTENHSYRETMFQDAAAFYQQIPFYKIRILLIVLIAGLVELGFNIFVAAHFLSAVFTSLAVLVFYYAFRKRIHPALWLLLSVILYGFKIHQFAGVVTADSLAFLWLGLICYAFINKKWSMLYIFLASSVFVRTDLIVLVALFCAYLMVFEPRLRIQTVAAGVVTIVAYLSINHFVGNYGWSTVFYYAVVSKMMATHPLDYMTLGISTEQYLSAVFGNLDMFYSGREYILYGAVTLVYLVVSRPINIARFSDPVFVVVVISLLYVLIHYLLFPLLFARFFVGQFLLTALALLAAVSAIQKDSVR